MCNVATGETTAAPGEETTAVPPGKTPNYMEQERNRLLNSNCPLLSVIGFLLLLVISSCFRLLKGQKGLCYSFLFHVATEESTAAPGEKTIALPSGKTPNSMEKEKKR